MAGDVLLALAFRPFGQNRLLQGPQIRVVGHGLQALFDVDQAHVERAFLPGALGLFQELFGLQLGLSGLVLVGDLAVHLVAQRQQDGMVGHELQPLLDAGQAVRQSARLLVPDRLRQQLVGLGLALGGQVDGGRSRRSGRRRNGQRRSRWRRGRRPIQEQIAARDHRAGQGRRQGDSDFPAEPVCGSRGVARGRHQSFPRSGQAGGRFDGIQGGDDFLPVLKPLVGVFVQQLVQQRLKASQFGRQLRDGSGHMHHRQSKAVFGGVGHVAGQHLVEQHAEAVQVGAGIHRLAANLLRAHVARRADGQAGPGHDRGAAEGFGDAEVGQHRAAVFAEQDVLGLDVAVDDVAAVGVVQGAGHGAGDGQGFLQRQAVADALLQRTARQILHRQVIGVVVGRDVVNGDDVRVVELRDDAAFPQEPLGEFLVGGEDGLDHFQRDVAVQRLLHGEVDDRHAALAEFAFDLIAWNVHVQVLSLLAPHSGGRGIVA